MEEVVAKGKIFELVQTTQPDGRVFEVARRAPGTRVIVADGVNKKVLLTREFRKEIGGYDFRLPGGKVFDTLDEYEAFRVSGSDIVEAAEAKARGEVSEEAGVAVGKLSLVTKSTLGATVEWDLYVFETDDWHDTGKQALEAGEDVTVDWFDFDEVKTMIMSGHMQEQRIALVLLQWLARHVI